jgi:3-methyladenine DNA glycosylase AlkD
MAEVAMPTADEVRQRLAALADPEDAVFLQRFFKTGPGEYGEGDRFHGIRVPVLRRLAREYRHLPLPEVVELLRSAVHEERLLALLLLVHAYERGDAARHEEIYRLYLDHTRFINNWDLVDASAEHIVGAHLEERDRTVLERLARSDLLWERRIAVLATFRYLKRGDFASTLHIAGMLLGDGHDLIHKAVGWMLREVGKRDQATAEAFLRRHYRVMPRTMLRYAIERFPEELRQQYLQGRL